VHDEAVKTRVRLPPQSHDLFAPITGSRFFWLRDDVLGWMEDNQISHKVIIGRVSRYVEFFVEFDKPNDALLFKLRWLNTPDENV
jgi:hypothetical protein